MSRPARPRAAFAAALACGLALAAPVAAPALSVPATEQLVRLCANRERAAHGLPALQRNRALDLAAHYHAQAMLRFGFFDHRDIWGRDPEDRVRAYGDEDWYLVGGENISAGNPGPTGACNAWRRSPGHHANMLDPEYTRIGGGFARGRRGWRTYFVQEFGTLAEDVPAAADPPEEPAPGQEEPSGVPDPSLTLTR
jgi:uncharacterized protein YkwD